MVITNTMNEIQQKAKSNLKVIWPIEGLNGLFRVHDCIFNRAYKGENDSYLWINEPFDLHRIVELPKTLDKVLELGVNRVFTVFESMCPLNIRKDAENGFKSAFQFWEKPLVQIRMDELMHDFLFEIKNYETEPEATADVTSMGAISILKAIYNVQQTILNCPRGMQRRFFR